MSAAICCSCGLFLLKYFEYWTGKGLSNNITQDDMTLFRTKLAAILLSSELNKRKGCLFVGVDSEAIGSPSSSSNVKRLQSPDILCKRKECHQTSSAFCLESAMEPFLLCGLSTFDMPMTKEDLIDMVCDYIMTINDAEILETVWVRSFQPYNVSITVRQLQASLMMKQPMPKQCFNIGVRLLAYSENNRMIMSESVEPNAEELAKSLETWPYMKYDASRCRFVLIPWARGGIFNLFVLDHEKKSLSVLDPTSVPDWCKDMPYKYYVKKIIDISNNYRRATGVKANERPIDVFYWKHILESDIPISTDRNLSGLMVLQFMSAWNNGKIMPISTDGQQLRKNFVIDILAYDGNSRRCMIPVSIREYLSRITGRRL